jgi:hypothetical protein
MHVSTRSVAEPVPADTVGLPAVRCLDCGGPLIGRFCHTCGQAAAPAKVPLRQIVGSAIEDTVGIDGRLWRTLRLLFRKPGALTLEFLAGRRRRYLPPFRLYLIASIVYFVALQLSGSTRFFFFQASGDPEGFGQFVRLLPRLMFLLLPTFAALVHLVYRRRGRYYVEHLVFALHYHALAFFTLTLEAAVFPLLRPIESGQITPLVIFASVISGTAQILVLSHLFIALRRVYGGSRLATFLRTFALFAGYAAILSCVGVLSIPWLRAMIWNVITG